MQGEGVVERTYCHTYFSVGSAGEIVDGIGFVAGPDSEFDPDEVTEMLGIQPWKTERMGEPRPSGGGRYPFSGWSGCCQEEPAIDAAEQCRSIVRMLKDKVPELAAFREKYHVEYTIMIVPHIYNEEQPVMYFDREVIAFCAATGTEIGVDLYVCNNLEPEM